MAIYKTNTKGWCIDEPDFYQDGFQSRDAARAFNADRKAGKGNEPAPRPTAKETTTTKAMGIDPNEIKVERGTEGKWWFIHKITGTEIAPANTRDGGRKILSDLKAAGKLFTLTLSDEQKKTEPVTVTKTEKITPPPPAEKSQAKTNECCKPKEEPVVIHDPLAGMITTGLYAIRGKKFTVTRVINKSGGSYKIKVNGTHIGTFHGSYDDCLKACAYIMRNRVCRI